MIGLVRQTVDTRPPHAARTACDDSDVHSPGG